MLEVGGGVAIPLRELRFRPPSAAGAMSVNVWAGTVDRAALISAAAAALSLLGIMAIPPQGLIGEDPTSPRDGASRV